MELLIGFRLELTVEYMQMWLLPKSVIRIISLNLSFIYEAYFTEGGDYKIKIKIHMKDITRDILLLI